MLKYTSLLLAIVAMQSYAAETLTYDYISLTEGKKNETTWTIEKKGNTIIGRSISSNGEKELIELTADFTLQKIDQDDPAKGKKFSSYRDRDQLISTATLREKSKTKTYTIGNKAWVQEFVFGFKDFLASSEREYKFQIINPEDLDIHDMIAIKQFEEELTIDSTKYKALKMKITLEGFKGNFWKAEAWYDTATHKMLRYRANEGPNTPITDTLFVSVKGEN